MGEKGVKGEQPRLSQGPVGYCTNVHAATSWAETLANLQTHAVEVRRLLGCDQPMPVGLWLPASAARELVDDDATTAMRHTLDELGLSVETFNGFPYGDFHDAVVKHQVYQPGWQDPRRLAYTFNLIDILAGLIDEGQTGSISTVPIGWPSHCTPADHERAAGQLLSIAQTLETLEEQSKRLIHLDLEPEPGCVLTDSSSLVAWVESHLLGRGQDERVRRYIRVCHDVCHAAVMFEDQAAVLQRYHSAGLAVGKLQISSAVAVDFDEVDDATAEAARRELARFAEDRYLHQTVIRQSGECHFYEDLPVALAQAGRPLGQWRVHFHVPIYLGRFGLIETTHHQIDSCLRALDDMAVPDGSPVHMEVETYAWNVLPGELQQPSLAQGIAQELRWLEDRLRCK